MSTRTKHVGYNNSKNTRSYKNPRQHPCRGFPAIFFTCESGREKKCQREALELIHHYYYLSGSRSKEVTHGGKEISESSDDKPLSLDEELKMLRKGAMAEEVLSYERNSKRPRHESKSVSSMKSPFLVHDVGMKGVVCIVFTLPGSELVPYNDIVAALRPKGQDDDDNVSNKKEDDTTDKEKDMKEKILDDATSKTASWDPIETVRIILKEVGSTGDNDKADTEDGEETKKSTEHEATNNNAVSTSPPGSRFISRMIPIQATCHASLNEIKAVTKALFSNYLNSSNYLVVKSNDKIAFKIDFKKRNCSHLSRDQIFEALVPLIMEGGGDASAHDDQMTKKKYVVNLTDPDFSVRIEVCKTFCGVSILPRQKWYKNFNLAELVDPSSKTKD